MTDKSNNGHAIPQWLRDHFDAIEIAVMRGNSAAATFTDMRTKVQAYFDMQADQQQKPAEWGSPKTVRQLISQLQTLDPDLETVALYRLPSDVPGVGGKVRQGYISTSYERMEGQWLGPYKGSGRLVLAFWTKLDPRENPDGEPAMDAAAVRALMLPESKTRQEVINNTHYSQGWNDCIAETARLNAPQ
ncbi:hypothetical protein PSCICL_47880 [Pseudomonas cichorii]|nr:hypothetical protein PSCICL_47880 [Pseudomonas cichorii]